MADVMEPRSRARLWRGSHRGGLAGTTSFPHPGMADRDRSRRRSCCRRHSWAGGYAQLAALGNPRTIDREPFPNEENADLSPRQASRPRCWRRPIA